jgi:glycosyltransferase involved in cell wall biosynthesis
MLVHAYYPLGESRVEREAHALIQRGYEVDVICLRWDNEPSFEKVGGVNVYRLPVKRHQGSGLVSQLFEYLAFFFLTFFRLLGLYPQRKYRVVQVHNLPDFLIFSALVPKCFGARLILDLHDLMPEFFAASRDRGMESWPVRLMVLQEQLSCRFADHVVTVTDTWRDTLIRRGVPSEKISVVMNVADGSIFHPDITTGQRKNANGRFNLIYHGTLVQRYGVDVLVRAIQLARNEIPGVHLTIQGAGEFREDLEALVEALGLGDNVTINANMLHVSELPRLIGQADVGVVPNRSDIFTGQLLPTKLLEYVALNVPVISARTPGIAAYFDETMLQFFTPGSAGELAGCILSLYKDRLRRAELVENSKRFNQEYSWETVASNYVALVDSLSA